MNNILFYAFFALFGAAALNLLVAGLLSFKTQRIKVFVGNKSLEFEGKRAIIAGIVTTVVGLSACTYAAIRVYQHYLGDK
jgi:uncharacterized membrane protein